MPSITKTDRHERYPYFEGKSGSNYNYRGDRQRLNTQMLANTYAPMHTHTMFRPTCRINLLAHYALHIMSEVIVSNMTTGARSPNFNFRRPPLLPLPRRLFYYVTPLFRLGEHGIEADNTGVRCNG